ncbi:MAG: C40 family peptidase [Gammaproteobacteria bacterium]|nr:C40 family peptidase [Gammaproteobacteria bacterium]MBU1416038.1 C40 family peptidase [Gammaproteobacteria bacterium]
MDTKYRFGGRNPDAGFDCSGMVSYVFNRAAGVRLTGSAASIAKKGRAVSSLNMKPGDLVFFNTLHRPHSHVGIYLGDGRFIHAPSSRGEARVRTDSLREGYFAHRFEGARRYLD